ncbi:uncharacterized protein LOC127285476 [Leptopilina boulardi]|uniref:uncharacterized protein LOC127285476 n=1 Tax=Leptopilina boulardi TaxID=63433 RepID=UPI0021F665C3|nr:uncharacterized protein LOC127285476 [Leptopilina boulardi]
MYKIIFLLFICFVVGQGEDRSLQITWGIILKGLTPLVSLRYGWNQANITWNANISDKENPLRATYAVTYLSPNITTKYGNSSNLCNPAQKGSFEGVLQTLILKTIANTDSCPIQKGTTSSYSTPFNHTYTIDKSGGCGNFIADIKIFRQNHRTNLFPVLINTFGGKITGC